MRSDAERLEDILGAIEAIEARISCAAIELLEADEMLLVWGVFHLLQIGESCSRISREFRSSHPQIEWERITQLRNIIVHEYFRVDPLIIKRILNRDLPELKRALVSIIETSSD